MFIRPVLYRGDTEGNRIVDIATPVKRIVRSFERLDEYAGPACRISSPD
jgi:hypothetical protein